MFRPLDVWPTNHFLLVVQRFSPTVQQMYDMTCTIGLILTSFSHWWPSSRLSDFTSYFTYVTSHSRRTFPEGVQMFWWTKSWSSDFDTYFAYYPIDMAETWAIEITSMASTHWWPLSLLSDITSYFAYITSYPNQTCIIWLDSKSFNALMNKFTVLWFWLVFHL